MKITLSTAFVVMALFGCSALQPDWSNLSDSELLWTYATYNKWRPEALAEGTAELKRRGLVREEYWSVVESRRISIGMTTQELLASWGRPNDSNRTVTKHGTQTQWVYGEFPHSTYVYTEDGIVTSWQQ